MAWRITERQSCLSLGLAGRPRRTIYPLRLSDYPGTLAVRPPVSPTLV